MPIYQYECRKCQHQLEEFQKADDKPLLICPECTQDQLFRVISGGLGFFMSGRTVGAISDKNDGKFSKDFKEHLKNKNKTKKVDTLSKKLKPGLSVVPKANTDKPFYKKNQKVSDKQLQSATPEQKQKYIETGKM